MSELAALLHETSCKAEHLYCEGPANDGRCAGIAESLRDRGVTVDAGLRELEGLVGAYLDDLTFGRKPTASLDALRHHFVYGINRAALAAPPRECEHRRATPCVDRNGSCGTHLSPWADEGTG